MNKATCLLDYGEIEVKKVLNFKRSAFWVIALVFISCIVFVLFWHHSVSDNEVAVAYDLEKAVSDAILNNNTGSFLDGECQGEGHYIMDSTIDGTTATAYVLTMYGEYGFQDGNFVKVSGTGVIPTVIIFSIDKDGNLFMESYQMPEDGEGYGDSISRLFPKELQFQCLHVGTVLVNKLKLQEKEYATKYLESIGRSATVGEYGDFEHTLLTDLGVSVQVSNTMIANKKTANYPFWIGNLERLEDGTRFFYELSFDEKTQTITYSKLNYDTKTVTEKLIFDSISGKELSMNE